MAESSRNESALQAVEDLSQWLAESTEYGIAPQEVSVVASYVAPWPWEPEEEELHLLHFVLPNGREGIGIGGPVAFAFSDRAIDFSQFEHDELLKLYAGWYLLYELVENEDYQPTFSDEDDRKILQILQEEHGITNVEIVDRVRIDDHTFFEMTGVDDQQPCRIAGSFDGCFSFFSDDKYYGLPALYYVMGWVFYADEEDDLDDDEHEEDLDEEDLDEDDLDDEDLDDEQDGVADDEE